MAQKTIDLMFEGELHECLVTIDKAGEFVCYRKDGRFIKFPADGDLKKLAKEHNAENGKPILPPVEDDTQAKELAAWLDS